MRALSRPAFPATKKYEVFETYVGDAIGSFVSESLLNSITESKRPLIRQEDRQRDSRILGHPLPAFRSTTVPFYVVDPGRLIRFHFVLNCLVLADIPHAMIVPAQFTKSVFSTIEHGEHQSMRWCSSWAKPEELLSHLQAIPVEQQKGQDNRGAKRMAMEEQARPQGKSRPKWKKRLQKRGR